MQLGWRRWAVVAVLFFLCGGAGAYAAIYTVGEYRRYQAVLATLDSIVAVLQQNIKAGKIDGLPPAGK